MNNLLLAVMLFGSTAFANTDLPSACESSSGSLIETKKDGSRYVVLINEAARDLYAKISLSPDSKTIEHIGLNDDTEKALDGIYCYRSDRIKIDTNERCAEYDCRLNIRKP